jgi:hypothetical protein
MESVSLSPEFKKTIGFFLAAGTTKDFKHLRNSIKESLHEHAVQFLEARYQDLSRLSLNKATEEIEEQGREVGDVLNPIVKRKRGRPTKAAVEQRDKYGSICPVLARLPNGAFASYRITPKQLGDWRSSRERKLKAMGFEALIKTLVENGKYKIDWDDVAERVVSFPE